MKMIREVFTYLEIAKIKIFIIYLNDIIKIILHTYNIMEMPISFNHLNHSLRAIIPILQVRKLSGEENEQLNVVLELEFISMLSDVVSGPFNMFFHNFYVYLWLIHGKKQQNSVKQFSFN